MSITPKNWKSFQHYKERTPQWIKLHKGLLTDFTYNRLPLASRALAPMLWLLASEYEEGEITASMDEIAFRLHVSVSDLASALSPLIDSGFFISSEVLAKPEQVACLEKRREENKIEKNLVGKPTIARSDFEELKRRYPKRLGDYKWALAERKFNSLVKTGVPAASILSAVARLSENQRKLGNIGTQYVPMPASWLNSEDFAESAADAFADAEKPFDWDTVCKFYKSSRIWSRHAGPPPDEPRCRCPPDILRKYDLWHDPPDESNYIPQLKSMSAI